MAAAPKYHLNDPQNPYSRCAMTFALFNLNPIEILFVMGLGGAAVVGIVLWIFVLNPKNRGHSTSRQDDFERLREDHEKALDRIDALEDDNKRLRQQQSGPNEGHITP
jgi:hypothetical protein